MCYVGKIVCCVGQAGRSDETCLTELTVAKFEFAFPAFITVNPTILMYLYIFVRIPYFL